MKNEWENERVKRNSTGKSGRKSQMGNVKDSDHTTSQKKFLGKKVSPVKDDEIRILGNTRFGKTTPRNQTFSGLIYAPTKFLYPPKTSRAPDPDEDEEKNEEMQRIIMHPANVSNQATKQSFKILKLAKVAASARQQSPSTSKPVTDEKDETSATRVVSVPFAMNSDDNDSYPSSDNLNETGESSAILPFGINSDLQITHQELDDSESQSDSDTVTGSNFSDYSVIPTVSDRMIQTDDLESSTVGNFKAKKSGHTREDGKLSSEDEEEAEWKDPLLDRAYYSEATMNGEVKNDVEDMEEEFTEKSDNDTIAKEEKKESIEIPNSNVISEEEEIENKVEEAKSDINDTEEEFTEKSDNDTIAEEEEEEEETKSGVEEELIETLNDNIVSEKEAIENKVEEESIEIPNSDIISEEEEIENEVDETRNDINDIEEEFTEKSDNDTIAKEEETEVNVEEELIEIPNSNIVLEEEELHSGTERARNDVNEKSDNDTIAKEEEAKSGVEEELIETLNGNLVSEEENQNGAEEARSDVNEKSDNDTVAKEEETEVNVEEELIEIPNSNIISEEEEIENEVEEKFVESSNENVISEEKIENYAEEAKSDINDTEEELTVKSDNDTVAKEEETEVNVEEELIEASNSNIILEEEAIENEVEEKFVESSNENVILEEEEIQNGAEEARSDVNEKPEEELVETSNSSIISEQEAIENEVEEARNDVEEIISEDEEEFVETLNDNLVSEEKEIKNDVEEVKNHEKSRDTLICNEELRSSIEEEEEEEDANSNLQIAQDFGVCNTVLKANFHATESTVNTRYASTNSSETDSFDVHGTENEMSKSQKALETREHIQKADKTEDDSDGMNEIIPSIPEVFARNLSSKAYQYEEPESDRATDESSLQTEIQTPVSDGETSITPKQEQLFETDDEITEGRETPLTSIDRNPHNKPVLEISDVTDYMWTIDQFTGDEIYVDDITESGIADRVTPDEVTNIDLEPKSKLSLTKVMVQEDIFPELSFGAVTHSWTSQNVGRRLLDMTQLQEITPGTQIADDFRSTLQSVRQRLAVISQSNSASRMLRAAREATPQSFNYTQNPFSDPQ